MPGRCVPLHQCPAFAPAPCPLPHPACPLQVKIGGPAYRIGMGGGAASSVPSGSNSADLDFNAVQVSLGGGWWVG